MSREEGSERLAGSTILLTGGSGFVGKTVLAALLARAPKLKRLILVLRAADDDAAQRRLVEGVLESEAFADLPSRLVAEKLESGSLYAIAGDLESDSLAERLRGRLADVDTVIHSAASVSFEEPLDAAMALNAFGPSRLLDCLHRDGADPHFIHVSTAFAADCHQAVVPEDGSHAGVARLDPTGMLESAREWREEAERESREAASLRRFKHSAERDAAHRRGMDPVERAEQLRDRWVRQRLAGRGRRYAIAAGWPDTYALSKAASERLVSERSKRTTILRPSIIESALRQPHPGWLEGIKVADPLILAYAARGLTHLPGRGANRIDIVPVDFVANACVAAAVHLSGEPLRTLALASTKSNPLTLAQLAAHVRAHFGPDPLLRRNGSKIVMGDLKFVPQRQAVRRALLRERLLRAAARVAATPLLPHSLEGSLRRNSALAARVTRMLKIYGPYTELDCAFDDSNAAGLRRSLPPADRAELGFDPADIDWDHYMREVHMPRLHRMTEAESGPRG